MSDSRRGGIVVTGAGVVSAAGVGRAQLREALASGRSGIVAGEGSTPVARIADFGAKQAIDAKALRRLARLSQMGLVAAKEALAAANLSGPSDRVGIVLGTGLGTIKETIEFMKGYVANGYEAASPLLFPTSVVNAAAGQMALELGLRGVNTTVNHREHSALGAILMAMDLLALGRASALVVGALDEWSEPVAHGYRRLGALSATGVRPYAGDRDGTVLGEGAAMLVLEREEDAAARGQAVLARIAGAAESGEERPRVGWGEAFGEATATVRRALAQAEVVPSPSLWVAGGGCGLPVDALEARAVAAATDGKRVATSSIVGQTGAMMAEGALRVVAALDALSSQRVPGTVGGGALASDCPIADLVRTPRAQTVDAVLVPSLSEGGANAAIVLTR